MLTQYLSATWAFVRPTYRFHVGTTLEADSTDRCYPDINFIYYISNPCIVTPKLEQNDVNEIIFWSNVVQTIT